MGDSVAGLANCTQAVSNSSGGGQGGSAPTDITFLNGKLPSTMKIERMLMESEGMQALFHLPFFKNVPVSVWQKKIKNNGSALKPMVSYEDGFKSAPSEHWRKWALSSIKHADSAQAQAIYKEWFDLNLGKKQSISLDEYAEIADQKRETKKKNEYMLALQFGMSLFLPEAQAQNSLSNSELEELAAEQQNQEVRTASPLASPTPTMYGTPINQLTGNEQAQVKEEEEVEKNVAMDINRVGKYGPKKSMKYLGLGAAGIGLAVSMIGGTGQMVDTWIGKPLNRGLLMQATAILAIINWSTVKKSLAKVKSNRNYVRGILDRFKVEEAVPIVGDEEGAVLADGQRNIVPRQTAGFNVPVQTKAQRMQEEKEMKKLIAQDLGIPCPTGERDRQGNCEDPELADRVINQGSNVGGLAADFIKPLDTISAASKAATNGQFEKASKLLQAVGNRKSAKGVETALAKIKKQTNQGLFDLGQKIVDFEGQPKRILNDFQAVVKREARRAPGGLDIFAPLTGQRSGNNQQLGNSNSSSSKDKDKKAKSGKKGSQIVFSAPVKFGKNKKAKRKKLRFDFGRKRKRKRKQRKITTTEAFKDREVQYEDVQKTPDKSLFKILSNRYLKSALPHFFEEREPAATDKKSKK